MRSAAVAMLVVPLALALACRSDRKTSVPPGDGDEAAGEPKPAAKPEPAASGPCPELKKLPFALPSRARVVAIGDVHGDWGAALAALRAAKLVDNGDAWVGGAAVVVQTGDLLDRGDDEPEIMAGLERLGREARAAGGDVIVLNGNHEIMNAYGDFRYVTPDGFADYAGTPGGERFADLPALARGRAAAFAPGAPAARKLSDNRVAVRVGDTVFVHGGIAEPYASADTLAEINFEARCFLAGGLKTVPSALASEQGPIWHRGFGLDNVDCQALDRVLKKLGASRLVVGHTRQAAGINSACDGRVFRIDVGLASYYGGPIEVLQLQGAQASVLRGAR